VSKIVISFSFLCIFFNSFCGFDLGRVSFIWLEVTCYVTERSGFITKGFSYLRLILQLPTVFCSSLLFSLMSGSAI
jgi:hypothetical protein